MSIILALAQFLKSVPAILRALAARRHIKTGKELARGEMARKQMEKLEKAVRARRAADSDFAGPERLYDDDGHRRD